MTTSKEIYDAYEARSWRALARRTRDKGQEFVLGRREGAYIWDIDGERRLLDCALTGGVHSLGHRHPEVFDSLRKAIDGGLDSGIWFFPTPALLEFQDRLAALAPDPVLNRSIVTLSSSASIDLAVQFVSRVTGRRHVLAYRYGYHGHAGFAAMVTGSVEEGIMAHYGQENTVARFFERYGDLDEIEARLTVDVGAVILEAYDYETWSPAAPGFMQALAALCRARGALLIIDETRTGLGRSGRFWLSEHMGVTPDILILGKGLGGGAYPVSAVLTTTAIYDECINSHKYGFASSMGGNELACVVGTRVLEICSRPAFAEGVRRLSSAFGEAFDDLCARHPAVFQPGTILGGIVTIGCHDSVVAGRAASYLFDHGVLCHSVSVISPARLKFYPILTADPAIAAQVAGALAEFARTGS
jgi:acetylornithine/succinyldiaminopimelate/putrescine aminotransferase